MADESLRDETGARAERERLRGLDSVSADARELADRLRETGAALGGFAERELGFAVGLAERVRDRTVSPELLKEARAMSVISGLRGTAHRVVDLGFDALSVTLRLGSDTLDEFMSAPRERSEEGRGVLVAGH